MNTDQRASAILIFDGYQTLGKKTYWLFVSKWLETPFAFLIGAVVVSFVRRTSVVPAQYQHVVAIGSLALFGLSVVSFFISISVARFAYRSQGFCLSDDALKIRRGVFTKQEIAIPYRQIQNVDVERTFFQQIAGVSKLVIVTAGSDDEKTEQNESKGILENLDKEVAVALQEELLRRADIQKVIAMKP